MNVVLTDKNDKVSPFFLMLFGLPFLLVGLFVFAWGGKMVWKYHISGSWKKVPARVTQVEWHEHRGSKGSRTYSVTGKFQYSFGNSTYIGTQITVEDGSSSEYNYWRGIYDEMKKSQKDGATIEVRVNPEDPDESIAFRYFNSTLIILPIFGIVFSLAGAGVILSGFFQFGKNRQKENSIARYPDQPWRYDSLGAGFKISSGALKKTLIISVISIGATCFISIFWIAIFSDSMTPLFAKLIVGFFTLIILLLDFSAVYSLLQYLKYGESTLITEEFPIATGKPFNAAVLVSKHIDQQPEAGIKVNLKCIKKTTTGTGKQKNTHIDELHDQTIIVKRDLGGTGRSAIPFTIDIPRGLPSRLSDSNPQIEWKLEIAAETPGIDFGASFELPVYNVIDPSLIQKRTG
ncbi:MAG: DUF3592 domain-containing protein [Candidatus Riflebacteria bacterium]|nr:DUF3592 domain-containing protein [Candidatus Riflebacteria bacterium]